MMIKRVLAVLATIIGLVAAFLPWVALTFSADIELSFSLNAFGLNSSWMQALPIPVSTVPGLNSLLSGINQLLMAPGILIVMLLLIVLILFFVPLKRSMGTSDKLLVSVIALILLAITLFETLSLYFNVGDSLSLLGGTDQGVTVSVGIGTYLMILPSLFLLIAAWLPEMAPAAPAYVPVFEQPILADQQTRGVVVPQAPQSTQAPVMPAQPAPQTTGVSGEPSNDPYTVGEGVHYE